jgi:hypothetical protein
VLLTRGDAQIAVLQRIDTAGVRRAAKGSDSSKLEMLMQFLSENYGFGKAIWDFFSEKQNREVEDWSRRGQEDDRRFYSMWWKIGSVEHLYAVAVYS